MSDTLISYRPELRITRAPADPSSPPSHFTLEREARVEVVEKAPADSGSILEIINALLMKETVTHEELVALRARLRRYVSQVNRLASLLKALQREPGPGPAPSSTSSSLAPSTSSSCQSA